MAKNALGQRGPSPCLGSCISELTMEMIALQSQSAQIEIEKTRVARQLARFVERAVHAADGMRAMS